MKKRQNLNDPRFVDQKLARGDGRGRGPFYRPWITVHDIFSKGVRYRIWWSVTGRIHHFLSFLEYQWFVVFATDPTVIDIREAFPLLDFDRVSVAAEQVKKEFPNSRAGSTGNILTNDLVVTRSVGGEVWDEPYSVRYASETTSESFIHRHRLSSIYWAGFGAAEEVLTDENMTREKFHSAEWLFHATKSEFMRSIPLDERLRVAAILRKSLAQSQEALSTVAVTVDEELGLREGFTIDVARWMLATRRWNTPTQRPLFSLPLKLVA